MNDASSDLQSAGAAPDYVDIERACVQTGAQNVRAQLSVAGNVPQRMPNRNTNFSVSFELAAGTHLVAEADTDGWMAYVTRGDGRKSLRNAISIEGNVARITIDWAQLGTRRPLEWKAETSWTSASLTTTSYAFDSAPDTGRVTR